MSGVLTSPPAPSSSRFSQPGEGSLPAPRPGDGSFLASGPGNRGRGAPRARGHHHGNRGGPGNYRGPDRRTPSVNEIPLPIVLPPQYPYDLYPQYSGPGGGYARRPTAGEPSIPSPVPNGTSYTGGSSSGGSHNGRSQPYEGPGRGHATSTEIHPVVQPRAEAARRAEPHVNGFHGGPSDNGYPKRLAPSAQIAPANSQPPKQAGPSRPRPNGPVPPPSHIADNGYPQFATSPRGSMDRRAAPTPRQYGGRIGPGMGDGIRDRPAHLDGPTPKPDPPAHLEQSALPRDLSAAAPTFNPTAPAFTPQLPTESFSRLSMSSRHSPAASPTDPSSRTASGEGRSRTDDGGIRKPRERKPRPAHPEEAEAEPAAAAAPEAEVKPPTPSAPKSNRRAAFEQQTKLTTAGDRVEAAQASKQEEQAVEKEKETRPPPPKRKEEKDDLISRLTRGLGKRPYVECPICFNSITPSQPIFCCLPPTAPPPPNLDDEAPTNYYQACYAPFHLSCIRDWADRSLAEESEKIRTNLLVENDGKVKRPEWRCPGCQKRRVDRVGLYKCFCGRVTSPSTNQTLPHSCAGPCSRPRPLCSHPCTLPCHPGPCPPCQVALIVPCPSHHSSLTVKCAAATVGANMTPVCDEVCGRERGCGDRSHTCQLLCHFGPCAPCTETEVIRCYCGEDTRVETCGWKKDDEMQCAKAPESGVEEHWLGRWGCGRLCNEAFDCGLHTCEETCHPHPLFPLPCPNSPSQIHTCPCGQTPLSVLCQPEGPKPARTKCTDPIPTCSLPCPQTRPCGHQCPLPCHTGECPPCHQDVVRPCRCGESVFTVKCEQFGERIRRGEGEMRCERVCKALRNCGRHECSRVCCPLAYKAKSSRVKKKAGAANEHLQDLLVAPGEEDLHVCSLTCGKWLSCGLHTCQRKDHRGACGRCLQASYDELICHCGESIIYPPVACGTTITCSFPCARPPPTCGHPKTTHSCHESPACPPCPYLTTRPCACGKDPAVKNVRCSQTIVSCGQTCGNLLSCGYHRCDKTCHKQGEGECGDCTQVCGKPKRVCRHPCTSACHAPAKCPESDPCGAIVDQKCACGNLSTRTTCGASANGTGTKGESRELVQLKCNSECLVKQRNARLAEALGIKGAEGRSGGPETTEWTPELKAFAQGNWAFVKMVEGVLAEFWKGGKFTQILPQMPAAKRTFVLSLAQVYRLGTDLLDAEPNRSIMIRRKIDTRIPNPLLSAAVTPTSAAANGEKKSALTNLRATPATTAGGSWGKVLAPTPTTASPWGNSGTSGASTPASSYATPMSSRALSPAVRPSRPVTPSAPESSASHTATTMTVPVNQAAQVGGVGLGLARTSSARGVVGEVGKVEEDDWDVDA